MELAADRGDSVEEHVHQEGKSVVQVHGWAMGKGKKEIPKKSAEEGRNDINTRFFAVGKSKKGTFLY